jgi:transposase
MGDLFLLSEAQMRRIERYFLRSHGVARVDDRRIVSAIVFVIRNGLRWRDAPREYGPHKTIYNRFIRWSRLGVFNKIFAALARKGGRPERIMIDATGVIVAAPIHPADEGDTTTLSPTLEVAACNLAEIGLAPSQDEPSVLVADKGYHARDPLKALDGGVWKTRIAEPEPGNGYLRWRGEEAARKAVYANRARLKSGIGRETMRRRGELVERSFAHVLDRGGMRRAWLRGRENIHKRYLIHVAGFNLGVLCLDTRGLALPCRRH